MNLTEKSAYIKGLMEGLDLDSDKKEVKVIKALVDLVEDLALTVTDLDEDVDQVYDELDAIDEDLTEIEDAVFEDDEDDEDLDDDEDMYEITCPSCGETVCVDEDTLLSDDLSCPACGEKFEIDFDGEGDACEGCAGCGDKDDKEEKYTGPAGRAAKGGAGVPRPVSLRWAAGRGTRALKTARKKLKSRCGCAIMETTTERWRAPAAPPLYRFRAP